MANCYDKARELGTMILESEESKQLSDAGAAFDADENAKKRFDAYKSYHQSLQEKMTGNELNPDEIKAESQKLSEMAMELKQDPVIAGLIFAEDNFNTFVAQVMNVLRATINGTATDDCACSPNGCSSCSGCAPN